MPSPKPQNWVTRDMEQRARERTTEPASPDVDLALLEWLETMLLARCYDHRSESLEDHLVYTGQVQVVQMLRVTYDKQQDSKLEPLDPIAIDGEEPVDGETSVTLSTERDP
jgi:hypothetical protein